MCDSIGDAIIVIIGFIVFIVACLLILSVLVAGLSIVVLVILALVGGILFLAIAVCLLICDAIGAISVKEGLALLAAIAASVYAVYRLFHSRR